MGAIFRGYAMLLVRAYCLMILLTWRAALTLFCGLQRPLKNVTLVQANRTPPVHGKGEWEATVLLMT
jgi:hypothetical protein